MKVFVMVTNTDGYMEVTSNVDNPTRVAMLQAGSFITLAQSLTPGKQPEGRPPGDVQGPAVARAPSFAVTKVA